MMRFSLSQHPIMGRVFARHRDAREVGFADDLNIYASLKTDLKVLVEMRQRFGEDAKLSFNMTKVKIYIPCVTRERARELVLQHIEQDPSLEILRELYEQDLAKPELDIITVAGLKCVGVPIGTPEFVNAFVRSNGSCSMAWVCPCHRARCSKASHRPGPKNSLRFAALLPTHAPCISRPKRAS